MKELVKANLTLDDESNNGEGVWVIITTPEDMDIYDNENLRGKNFKAILDNQPVSWKGVNVGDTIILTNNGQYRPVARLRNNPKASADEVSYMRLKHKLMGGGTSDENLPAS